MHQAECIALPLLGVMSQHAVTLSCPRLFIWDKPISASAAVTTMLPIDLITLISTSTHDQVLCGCQWSSMHAWTDSQMLQFVKWILQDAAAHAMLCISIADGLFLRKPQECWRVRSIWTSTRVPHGRSDSIHCVITILYIVTVPSYSHQVSQRQTCHSDAVYSFARSGRGC